MKTLIIGWNVASSSPSRALLRYANCGMTIAKRAHMCAPHSSAADTPQKKDAPLHERAQVYN